MPIPNLISLVEQDRQRNQRIAKGITNIVVSGVRQIKEQSKQKDNAINRANRGVRPPLYNATAELQDALWKTGAFRGVKTRQGKEPTYAQAVDGINGGMTKQAIANAKSMGYTIDENTGRVGKGISLTPRADKRNTNIKKITVSGGMNTKPVTSSGANIPMQVIQQMNYSSNREAGRFSPINQYFKDIIHKATAKEGSPDIVLTNNDFSQAYNEDASRIAQIAYRQYVRKNGYPKSGQIISLPVNPSVYKEINKDGKYANFSVANIIKAAMGGDNQVEFTDGGMSGKAMINSETGNLDVTFTDRTAWDDAPSGKRIGNRIRQLMEVIGSSEKDNKGDYVQNLKYSIPRDTIEGNYKGKLRNIPHYYK